MQSIIQVNVFSIFTCVLSVGNVLTKHNMLTSVMYLQEVTKQHIHHCKNHYLLLILDMVYYLDTI